MIRGGLAPGQTAGEVNWRGGFGTDGVKVSLRLLMGSRKNSGLGGSLFLNGWGVSGPHFGYNDVHEKPARKQWEKAGQCQTHTYWQTHNTHIFPVRRRNATRKKKSGGKIAGDTVCTQHAVED